MELKEGMYVITTDRLEIGRITGFCECEMCKERGFYEPTLDNPNMFITNWDKKNGFHGYKFYKNLIDLIEVGDYVNGYEVTSKDQFLGIGNHDWYIADYEIKSIVTKEQFSRMEYRLGE